MSAKNTITTAEAVLAVLKGGKPTPMKTIIEKGVPMTALSGKTPGQVFYSTLYSEAKRPEPRWVQTGKGEFTLAPKRKKAVAAAPAKPRARKDAA